MHQHKKPCITSILKVDKRRKWQETAGQMPCLYCRKMCCLNGSRKLHFVQKIRLDRIIKYLGSDVFFARSAIFCRYWTCTFSCRNNQAIEPRLSAIFTFLFIPFFASQIVMDTSQKAHYLHQLAPIEGGAASADVPRCTFGSGPITTSSTPPRAMSS